jgi:hypothetical protein
MALLRYLRGQVSNLPRASRMILACMSATLVLILIYSRRSRSVFDPIAQQHVIKEPGGVYRIPKGRPPSVNLVVAATSTEDYCWVENLRVPELVVVPYIADNFSALHHPQKNKGHEAMIYHQYFYDYYDNLPDVSILIHSHQQSWHIEQLLEQDSKPPSRNSCFSLVCSFEEGSPLCVPDSTILIFADRPYETSGIFSKPSRLAGGATKTISQSASYMGPWM